MRRDIGVFAVFRVIVRVNDRGPFLYNRVMDLSYAAATALDYANKGTARVRVERLTNQEIADALAKTGIKLDKRKITIAEPIKNVGTYTVTCKLGYEISAPLTVKIVEA